MQLGKEGVVPFHRVLAHPGVFFFIFFPDFVNEGELLCIWCIDVGNDVVDIVDLADTYDVSCPWLSRITSMRL